MLRASLVLASLTAFIASPALAAAPTSLAFEGVLTTSGGTPATDGSYAITFSLYTSQAEKSPFWQEGPSQVVVKKGSFATALGLTKPLNATKLAAAKSAWLGIKVGTDPELTRQPLRSVAYAPRRGARCSALLHGMRQRRTARQWRHRSLKSWLRVRGLSDEGRPGQRLGMHGLRVGKRDEVRR